MTQELRELRREIQKTREHLNSLEHRLVKMQQKKTGTAESDRVSKLQNEVKRRYPGLEVDREVLTVVGTLPNLPTARDKKIVRKVIAGRHG